MSILQKDPESLEMHMIAKHHPLMSEFQLRSLREDIELNGQLEPIKLYRGKVVDGRHRLKSILAIGIDHINCVELPNNLTLDEVRAVAFSTEKRRHQTPSQRACAAYLEILSGDVGQISLKCQAVRYGICHTYLSKCKKVAAVCGLDVLKQLSEGRKVTTTFNERVGSYTCVNRLYADLTRKVINKMHRKPLDGLKINYTAIEIEADALLRRMSAEEQEYLIRYFIEKTQAPHAMERARAIEAEMVATIYNS